MSEKKHQKFSFSLLWRTLSYARPHKRVFIWAAAVSVVFAFVSPARALLTQYTLDNSIVHPDRHLLLVMTLVMIGILLFETLLQFLSEYMAGWLGQTIIRDMRTKLFDHIAHLHLPFFDKTPIGTLVTRVVSDMEAISDIFSEGLLLILGDVLKILVIIAVMFWSNWELSLISLSIMPMLLIGANMFKNGVNRSFNEVRTQIARLNSFVQEHITGMSVVQIFNREDVELKKFHAINKAHRDANIRSIWYYSIFFPFIEVLASVSIGLIIWWGGRSEFSPGELAFFILCINMLFRPIRMVADRFNTLQMGVVASDRVFKVMDTKSAESAPPVVETGIRPSPPEELRGDIEFRDVSFAYTGDNYVLKNISFEARSGETVAIVGATGAGKSSIAGLINRFYEYNSGEIFLYGKSIRAYELSFLRKHIGIVLQDVFLYSDSIANNISLGNPAIPRDRIIESAKIVGAHEFIMRLPGNYDYNVMERGATLSVGQRQMISFIRAYLYNPKILILDEATSSIDTESEMLIQRATETLTQKRTSIVIAHRLATIQRAHKIIVMDKGKILETGTHQSLLKHNGQYKKLFELQFKKEAA